MGYETSKKETIVFKKEIPAGATREFSERVKANGTVEELRVRFYPGQELALQVMPLVQHKGHRYESLVTYNEGSDGFLSGDDDREIFPSIVSVEYDDEIVVRVTNTSLAYAYTLNVVVVIDYFGGSNRVISGVV